MQHAKVFVSVMGSAKAIAKLTLHGLTFGVRLYPKQTGKRLATRFVPHVTFVLDETASRRRPKWLDCFARPAAINRRLTIRPNRIPMMQVKDHGRKRRNGSSRRRNGGRPTRNGPA
ncbi:MAG: hypothetical protein U0798_21660 [Gemmataceae bacterium]